MTLDVEIGKLIVEFNRKDYLENIEYGEAIPLSYYCIDLVRCPDLDYDLCDKEATIYPRSASRSGSSSFWEFFSKYLPEIYTRMRVHPGTNDVDFCLIKPFIEDINALKCPEDRFDKDRMKWLKFWCNRAVELYGDDAVIQFS